MDISCRIHKTCLLGITSLLILMPVHGTYAQVTPSHVFQVTENIKAELLEMHNANLSKPKDMTSNLTTRRPRHVLQKTREIYFDVQKLRKARGLPENGLESIPVRDVTPDDVKKLMDKTLTELEALRPAFGSAAPVTSPLPRDKTPTDVYENLVKIKGSITELGIPRTVPNNVYHVALMIISDLNIISDKMEAPPCSTAFLHAKGKKPKDVYDASFELLARIKELTEEEGFSIPGGVIMPNKSAGYITPETVIDIMNNILAEIGAIKNIVDVTSPTEIPPKQTGKTPSNVYDAVMKAQAIVDRLIIDNEARGQYDNNKE